ncbi:MAG TPA: SBBP repeat-containing protein [candidate division Zixibacteria bacterium]
MLRRFHLKAWFCLFFLILWALPVVAQDINMNKNNWRHYTPPENIYNETVNGIATDDSGNTYVTGWSHNQETGNDYVTIKYNQHGDEVWVRKYNGSASLGDRANALAIDKLGNIYVTGWSRDNGTWDDYVTIKYYSNGDTAWTRRYNGPGNWHDGAWDIATDRSGNVYVTGWSWGEETKFDYATIKYDKNGKELWVRRYNGPGNSEDRALNIAIDKNGNACVSGISLVPGKYWDYVTIKYKPNGDCLWVKKYTRQGNPPVGIL